MNRNSLLHIIERLESFLGKLPEAIQKPVLHELTPLKELFLQQRPPRFVVTGSNKLPLQEIIAALFSWTPPAESRGVLMELFRWHAMDLQGRGTVHVLDGRGAEARTIPNIEEELKDQPSDVFLYLAEAEASARMPQREIENLGSFIAANTAARTSAKVVGIVMPDTAQPVRTIHNGDIASPLPAKTRARLQSALQEQPGIGELFLQVFEMPGNAQHFMSLLAREMPNEARVEMVRISGNRAAQGEIAQTLVKSTTAICAAIGAQPIPLADLPILTALQLVMVSGIMYISGRERSLRAATEFVGALGVNVGAGMLLREGTRALLKFFPGWGNVVCGMVAGAGTYAMGRAAIVYFLEGLSIKDARRTYLSSRKKRTREKPARIQEIEAGQPG
ncbi:MAG: GTPase [Verrucomicrobiota bacterium]